MLFDPGRHEPLLELEWDAARARETVRAIVEDLEETLGSGIAWPAHPLDEGYRPRTGRKTLYLGASGTLWAMWYLEGEGAVKLRVKPSDLIGRVYQSYLAEPDTKEVVPSYYLGEVGILLILWRLTRTSEAADRLLASIERNISNPTNEALWAAPGTMIGAWHMLEWTGERRWYDLFSRMSSNSGGPGYPVRTPPAICGRRISTATSCSFSAQGTDSRAMPTLYCVAQRCSQPNGATCSMTVVSRPCVLPRCSKTRLSTGPKTSEPRVPAERICSSSGAMGPQA